MDKPIAALSSLVSPQEVKDAVSSIVKSHNLDFLQSIPIVSDLPAIMEKKAHAAVDILLPSSNAAPSADLLPNTLPPPEENVAAKNAVIQPDTSVEINSNYI
jgi:hypothetical protein